MTTFRWPEMAACLVLFVGNAAAESREPLDEIQVTATRRAKNLSEVSPAVTVIPDSEIRDNKLVTDALRSQPGVFLQQTTPGQGAAIVRGLKGSEVLHLVDGFRLNNAIFRNAPTPFLALVPLATINRVEVLRGAPASLYGSDAVGGVVQVVSRFPEFDSQTPGIRRELYIGLDTAERGRVIRGSIEYGTAGIAGLISAEHLQTGDRRVGGGERIGPSGFEASALRLALAVNPESDRQWLFDAQLARQPDTPRIDELVPGYGQTAPSSAEYAFRPNGRYFFHVRYSATNGLGSADWVLDLGWQKIVDDLVTRDFASSLRNRESNSSDLAGIAVSATRDIGEVSWIAGFEYYDDRIQSRRFEEAVDSGAVQEKQSRYPDGSRARQAALYVNADRHFGERHSLRGGMRVSAVDVKLPAAGPVPEGGVNLHDVSADAGWLFDVTSGLQFVANVGRGFRAPNVFDLGTLGDRPGNRYNVPSPGLQVEHVTQIDAGLRLQRPVATAELVVYRLHYTDRITSVLTGAVTNDGRDVIQSRNVASAKIDGIEASADLNVSSSLTAGALLNYTWGRQTEPDGSSVAADRIPPLHGHLRIVLAPIDRLTLMASLQFAGRQDRLSPRDRRDVRIDPAGTAAWGTLDLRAEWRPGNGWQLGVELGNLLDRRYRMHGSGIDATGRNVLLSAARSW